MTDTTIDQLRARHKRRVKRVERISERISQDSEKLERVKKQRNADAVAIMLHDLETRGIKIGDTVTWGNGVKSGKLTAVETRYGSPWKMVKQPNMRSPTMLSQDTVLRKVAS